MNSSILTNQSYAVIYFLSHMQSLLQHGCGEVWAAVGVGGGIGCNKEWYGNGGR
jgi:hypothetical protein